MAEKMLKTRVINKHETQEDWEKATNFTPLQAEVIIYDADAEHSQARIKIGDGTTPVNDLPFISEKVDQNYLPTSENAQSGKAVAEAVAQKADKTEIDKVKEDLNDKIDKPVTTPEIGKILKVTSVNDDGTFICEWSDAPSGGAVDDVKINENSIVESGIAKIPIAGENKLGLMKIDSVPSYFGIDISNDGRISLSRNAKSVVDSRNNGGYQETYQAIHPSDMDLYVKAAMCDGKGEAWTADEKKASRERIGIYDRELVTDIVVDKFLTDLDINLNYEIVNPFIYISVRSENDPTVYVPRFGFVEAHKSGEGFLSYLLADTGDITDTKQHARLIDSNFNYGFSIIKEYIYNGVETEYKTSITTRPLDIVKFRNSRLPVGTIIKIWGVRA